MTGQFSVDGLSAAMWLRRTNGSRLISARTATEMVRMIMRDEHGQSELDRNEPLSVEADGEAWIVTGTRTAQPAASGPPLPGWAGPIYARISQFDGQILDYHFLLLYES